MTEACMFGYFCNNIFSMTLCAVFLSGILYMLFVNNQNLCIIVIVIVVIICFVQIKTNDYAYL